MAGVSVSTVSRVLNDRPDVAEGTRQRVKSVIAQLGYAPYVQTADRADRRTLAITMHYPMYNPGAIVSDSHPTGFFGGIGQAVREENINLHTITTILSADELLTACREQQIDGVILLEIVQQDWRVDLLREQGIPFVMVGQQANNTGLSFVDVDHFIYMHRAFEYLIELGHREIAFLNYSDQKLQEGFNPAVQSLQAYTGLCRQHQITPIHRGVSFDPQTTQRTALSMLTDHPAITAVITAFSAGASGCMQALYQLNRRVPEDVSIITTLATNHEADMLVPSLSALNFPNYEMGYRATRMLIDRLCGDQTGVEQILFAPQLIVRQSTGSPRQQ